MPEETALKSFDQAASSAAESLKTETVDTSAQGETNAAPTQTSEQPTAETPTVEAAEDGLLTQEEVFKLSESDREVYRRMQKAYTQKTQKIAEERKRLEQINQAFEAFQADPQGVLRQWAKHYGVRLAEENETATTQQGQANQIQAFNATESIRQKMRALLPGEENLGLADGMAQIFGDELERALNQHIDPIRKQQEAVMMEAAKASTEADFEALSSRHPDWKQHEAKMVELGKQWTPAPGIPVDKYLDTLYRLATLDENDAARTNRVLERISNAVSSAEPTPNAAVNARTVTPARPQKATLEDAFRAAKQGIAW